jgi:hypothetical protein
VTNDDLSRVMDTDDAWVFKRSGIRQRHFCPEGLGASDLATEASKRAIEAAGIRPREIDYIIFCTMTPDYVFPGSGALLGAKLGLDGVPALDIRQQCAAMLFGLQLVDGLIKSGAAKTILFVGAEAHAGFMPWEDWEALDPKTGRVVTGEARARRQAQGARGALRRRCGRAHLPRDRSRRGPSRPEAPHRRTRREAPLRRGGRLSHAPLLEVDALRRAGAHPDDGRA